MDLKGRKLVVTGGAGDIGVAVASSALQAGGSVALIDNRPAALAEAARSLGVIGACADITDPASVYAAFSKITGEMGAPDILVNNAGGIHGPTIDKTDLAQWSADLELNLTGAFVCFKAALEGLVASGRGRVINIASVNGLGVYGHPGYSAAKAGLIQFTRSIAVEYGRVGLRANAVCPGSVKTRAWQKRLETEPELLDEVRRFYPMGDVCTPQDVANVVTFLVSDAARMISGAVIPIDGGLTAGVRMLPEAFSQTAFREPDG